jgi:hypothetical protein
MMSIYCLTCKHFLSGKRCEAFEEIPDVIFEGQMEHDTPLSDQNNDIVYEPLPVEEKKD